MRRAARKNSGGGSERVWDTSGPLSQADIPDWASVSSVHLSLCQGLVAHHESPYPAVCHVHFIYIFPYSSLQMPQESFELARRVTCHA